MGWQVPDGEFWQDKNPAANGQSPRSLGEPDAHARGSQAEMIAGAPEEVRDLFGKRVKLMAPLLKAWKTALKDEGAVDFSGLIHRAINILTKGASSARGNIFWSTSFRISRRSAPPCWLRCGDRTRRRRYSPLAMTGRLSIALAGHSSL